MQRGLPWKTSGGISSCLRKDAILIEAKVSDAARRIWSFAFFASGPSFIYSCIHIFPKWLSQNKGKMSKLGVNL